MLSVQSAVGECSMRDAVRRCGNAFAKIKGVSAEYNFCGGTNFNQAITLIGVP